MQKKKILKVIMVEENTRVGIIEVEDGITEKEEVQEIEISDRESSTVQADTTMIVVVDTDLIMIVQDIEIVVEVTVAGRIQTPIE